MYISFMVLLALSLHWFLITYQRKKQHDLSRKTLIKLSLLYVSSIVELALGFLFAILVFPPFGEFNIYTCPINMLSDFYPVFYNPVDARYTKKFRCSYEVVYPFQSLILVLYTFSTILMLLIRPFFVIILHRKYVYRSIYNALHFYPCLIFLHVLCGGLIYYSFPTLTVVSSIVFNAIHFTYVSNDKENWSKFILALRRDVRNWLIYFLHVIVLCCGLITFEVSLPMLWMAFVPGLLYILLWKFV